MLLADGDGLGGRLGGVAEHPHFKGLLESAFWLGLPTRAAGRARLVKRTIAVDAAGATAGIGAADAWAGTGFTCATTAAGAGGAGAEAAGGGPPSDCTTSATALLTAPVRVLLIAAASAPPGSAPAGAEAAEATAATLPAKAAAALAAAEAAAAADAAVSAAFLTNLGMLVGAIKPTMTNAHNSANTRGSSRYENTRPARRSQAQGRQGVEWIGALMGPV